MRTPRTEKTDWPAILADAVSKPGIISKAYSTFWNYSVGNQFSAMFQCLFRGIEPGPIHTYRGWQELGRQVKRGEKAIVLTMPVTVKRKHNEPVPTGVARDTTAAGDGAERPPDAGTRTLFVERPNWFVLSQTEGKDYAPVAVPEWDEPDGAELRVKSNPHDFGTYLSVVCYYDSDNQLAAEYAFRCDAQGPEEWDTQALAELAQTERSAS